jgi:predicted dehydrogenase
LASIKTAASRWPAPIYGQIFHALSPWLEIVAVCDPVREHCDAMAESLGVTGYSSIFDLAKDSPMEAALVVTPIPSHYPITRFLTENGIHCLVETGWCSMVSQCREMMRSARDNEVRIHVAENFFRFPIDRFAQSVRDSGFLGKIGRIFSYADHTGYHNNSRWIAFADSHPE